MITAPIRITAHGLVHSGKTVILAVIQKSLREVGFTNVEFIRPEESREVHAQMVAGLQNKASAPDFFKKSIMLEETCAGSEDRATQRSLYDGSVVVPKELSTEAINKVAHVSVNPYRVHIENLDGVTKYFVVVPDRLEKWDARLDFSHSRLTEHASFPEAANAMRAKEIQFLWTQYLEAVDAISKTA